MPKISSQAELNEAIYLLEVEQDMKGRQLKDQFYATYETFKPGKLFNSTLKDFVSSPMSIDNILGTAAGLTTGFLVRRVLVGASGGILKKLIGTALQLGVTYLVARKTRRR